MNVALKTISKSGFTEAFQKVELYRCAMAMAAGPTKNGSRP